MICVPAVHSQDIVYTVYLNMLVTAKNVRKIEIFKLAIFYLLL